MSMKQLVTILTLFCMLGVQTVPAQTAAVKSRPSERFLPNQTRTFALYANRALNGRITANDLVGLATRLRLQADVWEADGSSARILALVKANPKLASATPSSEVITRMHHDLRRQGWQGTEARLEGYFEGQTQADRVNAYNALAAGGVRTVLYGVASKLEEHARLYQLAAYGDGRFLRVSRCDDGGFRATTNTIGLLAVIYTGASLLGCVVCPFAAFGFGLTFALMRELC